MKGTMNKLFMVLMLAFALSAGAAKASTTLPYGTSFSAGAQSTLCTVTGTSPYVSCNLAAGVGTDGDVVCTGLTTADQTAWTSESPTSQNCWIYTGTSTRTINYGWVGVETPEPYDNATSTGYHRCVAEVSLSQTSDAYNFGWTQAEWPQGTTIVQDTSSSSSTNSSINSSPDKDEYVWVKWMLPSGASLADNSTYAVHIMCPIKPDIYSNLPSCNSASVGLTRTITDNSASVAYNGMVTAGGGSTYSTLVCDGTNWRQR